MVDNQDDSFDASKAEVFEALGHPTRIRLLHRLSERPLAFSELKRAAGLESNGLLSFHLGKLGGLVRLNPEGAYVLSDEGREALRMIEVSRATNSERASSRPVLHLPRQKAIVAGLVLALIVFASVAVYQQEQIADLNHEISSNTVAINGVRYWQLSESLQNVLDAKSIELDGVNFTTEVPALNLSTAAGAEVTMYNFTSYPSITSATSTNGVYNFAILPEIAVIFGNGAAEYWNQPTVTLSGGGSLGAAPEHVSITFATPPSVWLAPHNDPTAGIGWDESTGIMTFYVSVN